MLEYHSYFLALPAEFRAAQSGNVLVVYKDTSAVRALKQVDTAHQRGFSRAGEADYAEYLALFYLKAHIVRGVEFFAGVDVGLGNVLQTYHALLSPHCDVFRSPCGFGGRQHCMTVQFREALIKSRLTAWHAFCLHLFRYIAQFVLARRQPCVVLIVQSDGKSAAQSAHQI